MKKVIATIKKIIKKYFLVVLLVIVFILSAITSSYCAYYDDTNNYEQDPTYLLMNYYDNLNSRAVRYLLYTDTDLTTEIATFLDKRYNYFLIQTSSTSMRLYWLWQDSPNSTSTGTYTIFNNQVVPCSFGTMGYSAYYDIYYQNGYHISKTSTGGSVQVPSCYIGYFNENLYQWSRYRLGYKDLESISAMLTTIISTQETGNDLLNSINNKIQSVDNSINNDDTTGISTDIISENPLQKGETEGFFEGFYQSVVTAFTSTGMGSVTIPIGFVNQNMTIRGDLLSSQLENITAGSPNILDLIHLFWWFTFGIYIFKDIQKYKDDFKSGEVLNKTDTNITTEML